MTSHNLFKCSNESVKTQFEYLEGLLHQLQNKDDYTYCHCFRVSKLVAKFGKFLNLDEKQVGGLELAGFFHDIGKVYIPEEVLNKTGELTDSDRKILKEHPQFGYELMNKVNLLECILPGVLYHHERSDGKGYPVGLRGEEIPFDARLISIVDAFDAMISNRVYAKAHSFEKALIILIDEKGKQFDSQLVSQFCDMMDLEIANNRKPIVSEHLMFFQTCLDN